ncbi:hypothetical protein [Ureibacillus chungkukjangi]|uniref:Uncharacterized protein n=1 Tax=Ureibacillus chungkukjangi TaxID=1202712 RepID=A0A318TB81_9BACL|nr:hypothetical protein [Ureibacillus chungkukjangi]PYF01856.1 hypothetical protein BJ095_1541 [Ureibacillus chungkukjangi]
MYIVSLLDNESENRKEYILNNFYIPINLIEFKIDVTDIKRAFEVAKNRLSRIINSIEEIEIKVITVNNWIFSFRNNEDGMKVVYRISTNNEEK